MFEVDQKVRLVKDRGPCKAGCEGTISSIDNKGKITVNITHDPKCNNFTFVLIGVPPDFFEKDTRCD